MINQFLIVFILLVSTVKIFMTIIFIEKIYCRFSLFLLFKNVNNGG